MSPCEDGSGKPATGMKLTPRWPHTAFSCTTEGWAWARTRGGSVSYMCRIPAAGEQSGVTTISCETYGRTTCTPLVCIHTHDPHRNGIPYGVAGDARVPPDRAKDHHDQRRRRPARPRSARSPIRIRPRPSGCGMGCGWRVSRGVDSREWECPVARASRFTTPTSAHVKRRPLKA